MQTWTQTRLSFLRFLCGIVGVLTLLGFVVPQKRSSLDSFSPEQSPTPPLLSSTFSSQTLKSNPYTYFQYSELKTLPRLEYTYQNRSLSPSISTVSSPEIHATVLLSDTTPDGFWILQRAYGLKLPENWLDPFTRPQILYQNDRGEFAEFWYDDRAYRVTCLTPLGKTAFSQPEQERLRNTQAWRPSHLGLWVLGIKDLRDWRCLWMTASVDLDNRQNDRNDRQTIDDRLKTLEEFWQPWVAYWDKNFSF